MRFMAKQFSLVFSKATLLPTSTLSRFYWICCYMVSHAGTYDMPFQICDFTTLCLGRGRWILDWPAKFPQGFVNDCQSNQKQRRCHAMVFAGIFCCFGCFNVLHRTLAFDGLHEAVRRDIFIGHVCWQLRDIRVHHECGSLQNLPTLERHCQLDWLSCWTRHSHGGSLHA